MSQEIDSIEVEDITVAFRLCDDKELTVCGHTLYGVSTSIT